MVVMLDIFGDGVAQGSLAKVDHAVETHRVGGLDESFGEGVDTLPPSTDPCGI
jgi:hypothetical protein